MTAAQRAAVLLIQLGRDRAAKVLALLDETEVEDITAEIVRMDSVPTEISKEVLREFHHVAIGGEIAPGHGGFEYAQRLLEETLGKEKAGEVIGRLNTLLAGKPFDFLQQADGREVQSLLAGEHPQTVALVLAHLRPDRAAAIMSGLSPADRAEVAMRIATMEQASPDVISVVAENLQRKATSVLTGGEYMQVGGVEPLVAILNRSDPGTEKQVLEELKDRDEALAEQVRSMMFTFDDIVLLEDKAVQLVLRQVEISTLALALKGVGDVVREKVEKNLSERMRETLTEESEVAGRVRMSQVQEARGAVVSVIRQLEESGQIVVRRDEEDVYVQ
ncbi:MAG: flagellar motor switch protein FliG [Ancrocorticia sp.]|nr:flagellar motor switch protein FliG [Ancrocorticia sp.]MCI2193156.1 flagellar motor switch protein FliG [Ancrocorticia sp.]MCI2198844.1 flagellar motor switch protein FliG [Ancrocorticia sp.]